MSEQKCSVFFKVKFIKSLEKNVYIHYLISKLFQFKRTYAYVSYFSYIKKEIVILFYSSSLSVSKIIFKISTK